MNRTIFVAGLALIGFGLVGRASAQIDQLSLNYERIQMTYLPAAVPDVGLGLEFTVGADGSLEGKIPGIHRVSDVTLKRGVVGSTLPSTWLSFAAHGPREGEFEPELGQFLIELPHRGADNEAQVDLPADFADGSVRFLVSSQPVGSHIQLRFDPLPGQALTGEPAVFFGRSGTNLPLYAYLPVPRPGRELEVLLTLTTDSSTAAPEAKIRVKIKHGI